MSAGYDWRSELSAMAHNPSVQDYETTEQAYWAEQERLAQEEMELLVGEAEYCLECPFYDFERCAVGCEVDDV